MTGRVSPRRLISWRFSRITTVDLTSSPDMPTACAPGEAAASRIRDGCSMPGLTTQPLLVRMISTRFLPMSWTSPRTVASTTVPLSRPSTRPCAARESALPSSSSGRLQHEGQLHLPAPNNSPTVFMPSSRMLLMMSSVVRSIARSRSAPSPAGRHRRCAAPGGPRAFPPCRAALFSTVRSPNSAI